MTQAELRAELLAILRGRSTEPVAQCHAEDIAALFAARVAAIEAERDGYRSARDAALVLSGRQSERAEKAEAELAALQVRVAELTAERDAVMDGRMCRCGTWWSAPDAVECPECGTPTVSALAEGRVAAERTQAAAQALEQATGESYSPAEITAAVIAVREFFPRIPTGNLIEELRATRALLTADVPATPQELHGSTQESKARLGAPTPASSMGSAGEADIDPDGEAAHRQAPVTPEEPPQPAERNPDGSRIGGFCRDCADGPPYCPECPLHVSGEVSDERG